MRLLVAEDDPGLRSVLERGLREHGYVVDAVDRRAVTPSPTCVPTATRWPSSTGGCPTESGIEVVSADAGAEATGRRC